MHSDEFAPRRSEVTHEPVILQIDWTPDLYRRVTISVAPGRRWTCTVGPIGATDEQARQAALELLAHIKL